MARCGTGPAGRREPRAAARPAEESRRLEAWTPRKGGLGGWVVGSRAEERRMSLQELAETIARDTTSRLRPMGLRTPVSGASVRIPTESSR
jgi:hypothetical protein